MTTLRRTLVKTAVCALTVAALAVTGCQTVKGAGKDIQNAGEAGEKAISGD